MPNTIKELDNDKNETGYELIYHPTSVSPSSLDPVYTIFSGFEDRSFIEILVKKDVNRDGPQVKITFPRYLIELHGYQDDITKQWKFNLSSNEDMVFINNALDELPLFKGALVFEDVKTKKKSALIPQQEFYTDESVDVALDISQQLKGFKATYPTLIFDIAHTVKDKVIRKSDNGNNDRAVPEGPWNYIGSESTQMMAIDTLSGKIKPQSIVQALYMAYLSLCQRNPALACEHLSYVNTNGGLKGAVEELSLIENIMKALPRETYTDPIVRSSYIGTQAQALSLLIHFTETKGTIEFKPETNETFRTKAEDYNQLINKRIRKFYENRHLLAWDISSKYHRTRGNIHPPFQLSSMQELEMLSFCDHKNKLEGIYRARLKELHAEMRGGVLGSIRSDPFVTENLTQKAIQIEGKIKTPISIPVFSSYLTTIPITLKHEEFSKWTFQDLDNKKNEQDTIYTTKVVPGKSVNSNMLCQSMLTLYPDESKMSMPMIGMTDQKFIENFLFYFQYALETDKDLYLIKEEGVDHSLSELEEVQKKRLEIIRYCEGMVKARYHEELNKTNIHSAIPDMAALLIKVCNYSNLFKEVFWSFPVEPDPDETYDFFETLRRISNECAHYTIDMTILKQKKVLKEYIPSEKHLTVTDLRKIENIEFSFKDCDNSSFIREAELNVFVKAVCQLKKYVEEEIDQLIKLEFPFDKPYEKSSPNIKALDVRIGIMRNQLNDAITRLGIKRLRDPALRKKILHTVDDYIAKINTAMPDMNTLCQFANHGPLNINARREFIAQRNAHTMPVLREEDLNRLYVLADFNEYKKVTQLDDDDIIALHQKMADRVFLSVLGQTYTRHKEALKKCELLDVNKDYSSQDALQLFSDLAVSLSSENIADFAKDTDIQFFQKEENLLVYPATKVCLDKLLKRDEKTATYSNKIVQIMTGGGKSKTLFPIVSLEKANGHNLVIQQVKSSLINSHIADANAISYLLFHQEAIKFEFDRHSPSDAESCKKIYELFERTSANSDYLVTTGNSLQSLELKYIELLLNPPFGMTDKSKIYTEYPKIDSDATLNWTRQIKWLDKSLQFLKNNGDRVIDEIHDEGDPNKLLNFTLDDGKDIPAADRDLVLNLFLFFEKVDISEFTGLKNTTLLDLIKNPKIVASDNLPNLFTLFAQRLATDETGPINILLKRLCGKTAEDVSVEKMTSSLVDYLLNKSGDIIKYVQLLDEEDKDTIANFKTEISNILPFTLKQELNENYGPSHLESASLISKMIPIPYKASQTPSENSEFGHYVESMNYAIQMALQTDLPDAFVDSIIEDFVKTARVQRQGTANPSLIKTKAAKQFGEFEPHLNLDLSIIADELEPKEKNRSIALLKQSLAFKKYCLKNIILPTIKLNASVISSDPSDMVGMTHTTQAMSATPWNFRGMHPDFNFDITQTLGIDGETLDLIRRKNTQVQFLDKYNTATDILSANFNLTKNPNTRAIIDVGALFKSYSNENVAIDIGRYLRINVNNPVNYVLYYNDKDVLYALDIRDPTSKTKICLNTTNEKRISEILGKDGKPSQRFIYYDQAHSVGTDLVQFPGAHAIVTMSERTQEDQLIQGIKRERKFAQAQTVTITAPHYLKKILNIPDQSDTDQKSALDKVLSFSEENQRSNALKIHLRGTLQKFNHVIRRNLLSHIYHVETPEVKAKLLAIFKSYFVQLNVLNKFSNSGFVTTEQEVGVYFEKLQSEHFKAWMGLSQKASTELGITIDVSENAQKQMREALDKVKNQGIKACAQVVLQPLRDEKAEDVPLIHRKFDLGIHVENQTQKQHQTKQALQLETRAQTYKPNPFPSTVSSEFNLLDQQQNTDYIKGVLSFNVHVGCSAMGSDGKFYFTLSQFQYSHNIYVSYLFYITENSALGYFNVYTKPSQTIMFVESLKTGKLDAIMMLTTEAEAFMKEYNNRTPLLSPFADLRVWFESTQMTPMSSASPNHQHKDYQSLIEQLRFINGDTDLLLQQKAPYGWLLEDTKNKLDFMKQYICSAHLDKAQYFDTLVERIEAYSKVIAAIQAEAISINNTNMSNISSITNVLTKSNNEFNNNTRVVNTIFDEYLGDHPEIKAFYESLNTDQQEVCLKLYNDLLCSPIVVKNQANQIKLQDNLMKNQEQKSVVTINRATLHNNEKNKRTSPIAFSTSQKVKTSEITDEKQYQLILNTFLTDKINMLVKSN